VGSTPHYIYLDEAYNLTPGAKNQLIVLGGFGTSEPKKIVKAYKQIRKFALKRRQIGAEIKSSDRLAIKRLIPQVFKMLSGFDVVVYVIRQDKRIIPFEYWEQDKLNYEKLYLALLIRLLRDEWNLKEQAQVSVILDTFKTKNITKDEMIKHTRLAFKQKYSDKFFKIRFMDSAVDFNLQIADFIVGSFFKSFKQSPNTPKFNIEGLRLGIVSNIL